MKIDWSIVATIAAPIIALIVGMVLNRYFGSKARLISYLGHMSSFKIRVEKEFNVYTHSIVIRNAGRQSAHNVRIGHHTFPPNYQIFPAVEHTFVSVPDTGPEIRFPILVPGEQVTISYLYLEPLTVDRIHSYTKCDEGFAKIINVLPMQQFQKWFNLTVLWLAVAGLISVLYGVYEIAKLIYVVLKSHV
jgi:hypothetical protein